MLDKNKMKIYFEVNYKIRSIEMDQEDAKLVPVMLIGMKIEEVDEELLRHAVEISGLTFENFEKMDADATMFTGLFSLLEWFRRHKSGIEINPEEDPEIPPLSIEEVLAEKIRTRIDKINFDSAFWLNSPDSLKKLELKKIMDEVILPQ